jgi:hypothetical protein
MWVHLNLHVSRHVLYIDTYESRQIHITYFWTEGVLLIRKKKHFSLQIRLARLFPCVSSSIQDPHLALFGMEVLIQEELYWFLASCNNHFKI